MRGASHPARSFRFSPSRLLAVRFSTMFASEVLEQRGAPVVSLFGFVLLSVLFGAYSAAFEVFPYSQAVRPYLEWFVGPEEARLNRVGPPTPPKRWNAAALRRARIDDSDARSTTGGGRGAGIFPHEDS